MPNREVTSGDNHPIGCKHQRSKQTGDCHTIELHETVSLPSIYEEELRQEHHFFMALCNDKMRTKNHQNSMSVPM